MKILDLTIHGFHFRCRRQRKVTSKLDRITNAALLDAAVKNPEVLAQVVNKYGKIRVPHDDHIENLAEKIRVKIHKEAAQTILSSRRQELVSHIGKLMDMVMGLNSVPGSGQQEEGPFEGTTSVGQNRTSNIARWRYGMQRSRETSSNPSVLTRGLAMLAVLEGILNQQRKKQTRDSLEE